MFFDLKIQCEYYEDKLLDLTEENKLFDLNSAQEKIEPTIVEILNIYGMKEQYDKLLSDGNDITPEF